MRCYGTGHFNFLSANLVEVKNVLSRSLYWGIGDNDFAGVEFLF